MKKNIPSKDQNVSRLLESKIVRSRYALALEEIWPRCWYPIGVAGLFILLSLLDVWRMLPPLWHQIILGVFGFLLLVSLIPLARISWPSREHAIRRLERRSGVPHRPASTYDDTLSDTISSSTSQRLWQIHRQRLAQSFKKLRPGIPKPRIERYDPFALRAALVLLLIVGFLATSNQAYDRIKSAFKLSPDLALLDLRIDAWVTPPIYTGKPPFLLVDGAKAFDVSNNEDVNVINAPEKSLLVVRLNGADEGRFQVRITPAGNSDAADMISQTTESKLLEPVKKDNQKSKIIEFHAQLEQAATVQILDNHDVLYSWHFNIIDDTPPKISLSKPVEQTARGSLQLSYKVEDDYGVVEARANFSTRNNEEQTVSAEDARDQPLGEAPDFQLKLPRANPKIAEGRTVKDLTSHPWAGLKLYATLEARDEAGQVTREEIDPIVLPQRNFSDPLARAIVEQRRKLILRPWSNIGPVLKALNALTIAPEKFMKDTTVYLGLRSSYWRLNGSAERENVSSVVDLLWDIALRVEDGDLSTAERALREAQERLEKALEEGASDEEIQKLIAELRQAMNEFLQALAKNNQNQRALTMPNNLSPNQMLSSQDLDRMLKNIENLARTGAKDAARQMLSQLRNMLENLRRGGQRQSAQSQQMMNMMNQLGEMIAKQQQLLDETFQQQREQQRQGQLEGQQQGQPNQGQGERGQNGQGRLSDLQGRQKALEQQLQKLLDELRSMGAKPPGQLQGARRAMGEAEQELGAENLGPATDQQTLALDQMRQGAQQMAQQMMQGMQRGMQIGRSNRDPLGRQQSNGSPEPERSGMVPGKIDTQRAREILEELRRRLSEPSRPAIELDYIERLLRQF